MASYPGSIVSYINPSGTSFLISPDHALNHTSLNNEVIAIENTTGTTSGTSILKNISLGKFAVSDNGGTFNNGIIGTVSITGGTINSINVTGGTINSIVAGTPSITGGTASSITLGTPTILGGSIAVSGTTVAVTLGASLVPTVGTIVDTVAGTLNANAQAANVYRSVQGTSAGNRTIGTPTNLTDGQTLTYVFKASGSANGTLVWQSIFRLSQDSGTPAIGTGSTWNYYSWRYNGIDSKLDFQGQSKNIV